ncbi:MAG: termination of G-protein coupled receptor signaling pathway [Marteilia pararefringens]
MIYLIESDVLNRDHASESSLSQLNSNLDEVSQLTSTMDNRSMKRSTSRYDLSSIFEKAQQKLSLHKMRSSSSSSSSSRSCKINSRCVSIALPNIFQHISYEIKDSNDSIESIISRLFNQYKIFSNNYEIYCNNNTIPKESKIRNYVGMHLNVEYRIIFFITLPSGKRLGLKVNAFRDFKTLIVPVLLRYGYRMKNYIFTINDNTVPIDPGDIVTKLEGKEIKMKLKHQS